MKMMHPVFLAATLAILNVAEAATVISGVPSYTWYHGCEPTSIGMIIGYWDSKGYSNLFTAQGSAVYSTINVQDQISSPAHNAAYDYVDVVGANVPKTSIADFLGTSVDPRAFGVSSATNAGASIVAYAKLQGYTFQTSNQYFSTTWATLVREVDAGRPMLFFVDTDSNGILDHAVPAFGYDGNYNGDGAYYACYTTASENEIPIWIKFQGEAPGNPYGVYGGVTVNPGLVPEPSTVILFLFTGTSLIIYRRRSSAVSL